MKKSASTDIKEDRNKFRSASFVSDEGNKALENSTSNRQLITTLPTYDLPTEDFPRLDGNFELETEDEEKQIGLNCPAVSLVEMNKSNSKPKPSVKDRSPREVLRNLLDDPEMFERVPSELQAELRSKEKELEEVSPACDCASRGLAVADNGSFYTQLGHANSMEELR